MIAWRGYGCFWCLWVVYDSRNSSLCVGVGRLCGDFVVAVVLRLVCFMWFSVGCVLWIYGAGFLGTLVLCAVSFCGALV